MQASSTAIDSPSRKMAAMSSFPADYKTGEPRDSSSGQYSDSLYGSSSSTTMYGSSPDSFFPSMLVQNNLKFPSMQKGELAPCVPLDIAVAASAAIAPSPPALPTASCVDLLHCSLPTLLGCCEMLGHSLEDRTSVCR